MKDERRTAFESLVLSGIWILIRMGFGKRPTGDATSWRANVIPYFDQHGLQHDEAKMYRRAVTFPDLHPLS